MSEQKTLHLALQGGGAHGAFTWGVLDELLSDGRLKIEAISGTSAGALNAAAFANDYAQGDIAAARASLENLWHTFSVHGAFSPYNFTGVSAIAEQWGQMLSWFMPMMGFASPYQNNPFNVHFLGDLIDRCVDFDVLQHNCANVRLFVSATNVLNNKLRIFTNEELSVEVLLASSCLPKVHRAVDVDGEFFWDGGFMGNPTLEPLARDHAADDILIVQVNPIHIKQLPRSPLEIAERMETISFNSSLSREIRHIAQIERLIEGGELNENSAYGKHLHLLHAEDAMAKYSTLTKYDTSWPFLITLRDLGRQTTRQWLADHYDAIGVKNTLHLDEWEPDYHQPQCQIYF
ncbi:MAG: patatin-like phospholipase family protein [Cellvibrionaceae bacterium]|nr:patatin-like phospholipase family protein [Cellvibrionaceae bacterium]